MLTNNKDTGTENGSTGTISMSQLTDQNSTFRTDGIVSIENYCLSRRKDEIPLLDQIIPMRWIFLEILKISTPLLVASITDITSDIIANQLIVALDDEASDAVNLIMTTRAFGFLTFSSITFITSNLTGEAQSANRPTEVGLIYRQSLSASLLFSIPSVVLFASVKPLLLLLGQGMEAAHACEKFFRYFLINVPANFMLLSVQQSLSGLKKQLLIAGFNLISLPIFYFLGHALATSDKFGVEGIAITYSFRSFGLLTAYHIYFLFSKEIRNYKFFFLTNAQNEINQFKEIIKLGFPIVLDVFGEVGQFYMLNLMVGWLGGNAPIIQNVSTQYIFFAVTPSLALARSAGILIGNALGDIRNNDIRRIGHAHLAAGISTMITISFLAILLAPQLTNLFTPADKRNDSEDEFYKTVRIILAINSVGEVFDSVRNILTGSLRGLHSTVYPAISNNLSLWTISVPTAYVLSTVFEMGLPGIALGQCIGMAVSNMPLLYRWYKKSNPQQLAIKTNRTATSTPSDEGLVRRCINWCFWKKPTSVAIYPQNQSYQTLHEEDSKDNLEIVMKPLSL
jgi:multidrug resistance protein, MATE family